MLKNFLHKNRYQIGVAILLALFLYMRLPGLGTDITNSDAIRWHRRTTNFLVALKTGDFKETYQRYHPGVTLMWTNAIVKQAIQTYDSSTDVSHGVTIENSAYYTSIHQYSKIFQVLILAFLLICQLYLINMLFGQRVSLFYAFAIAIEPYLVGIDRWFHLTSLETYLAFTSLLLLLVWKKTNLVKYLIFGALALALAILSKVGVLAIIPVLFLILAGRCRCVGWWGTAKNILGFLVLTLLFVFILFPALWVDPFYVFEKVFNGIVGGVSEDVRFNPLTGGLAYLFYLVVFVIKLSPITLFLFPLSLVERFRDISGKKYIFLYLALYFISLSISEKRIDRYIVVMLPPILLFVSFYLSKLKGDILWFVLICYMLVTLHVKSVYYPVYSSYYSPLLGAHPISSALDIKFYNNSGAYYAQAGRFLNNIVLDQKVWVPYGIDSFDYYFKRDAEMEFTEATTFAVTSIDHLAEVQSKCSEVIAVFGTAKEPVVYVLNCK